MLEDQSKIIAENTLNPTVINNQLTDLTDAVLAGWISGIDAVAAIKIFTKALETAKKAITETAIEELGNYKGGFENNICKVELRNSARRYSFKHIEKWTKVKAILTDIEAESKWALTAYEKGQTISNEDGEIIEPAQVSGGGETVFITLKKQ